MDEITYTPGRLARKLGVSKGKLMRHLRETGLIEQCFASKSGRWQIPYSVAVRISSAEALSIPSPTPISRQTMPRNNLIVDLTGLSELVSNQQDNRGKASPSLVNEPKPVSVNIPDYAQIGRSLRRAGITLVDVVKYIEQQMGVMHEQQSQIPLPPFGKGENNFAKRDENQTDESKATSGGASSDISNSSAKQ